MNAPGEPFEESDTKEITDLIGRGVFRFDFYNEDRHGSHRLFKTRMVREIKDKDGKPYEKSRLIV